MIATKIQNNKGFTILEMMISMTLFALIITSVIVAVESLSVVRIKTLNRVALLEELYYFSEQLFTGIKDGGTLDYEEYWNRMAVWTTGTGGHYQDPTWVGNYWLNWVLWTINYWSGIYLCRSDSGSTLWSSSGCLTNNNNGAEGSLTGTGLSFMGEYQRYGQYLAQYTDHNGNGDGDYGDENADASGSIIGDDDDKALGNAPEVLTGSIQELYLINKIAKTRTFYRWNISQDPNAIIGGALIPCIFPAFGSGMTSTNSGCIGNVQILKLKWLDVWDYHTGATTVSTTYDGIIDTWVCTEDWEWCRSNPAPLSSQYLATGSGGEWINLFPSTINVKNLSFQIYPVKDPWLSWAAPDAAQWSTEISPFIHPYVRMNLEMWFSWGKRRTLRNEDPTISISTSVSLSDFD